VLANGLKCAAEGMSWAVGLGFVCEVLNYDDNSKILIS